MAARYFDFVALPPPLHDLIAATVVNDAPPGSDAWLCSLRLVSPQFNTHYTPLMFSSISDLPIDKYLRKVKAYISHPRLRQFLRTVELRNIDVTDPLPPLPAAWIQGMRREFRTVPNAPPATTRQNVLGLAAQGNTDAIAALLLYFCPNVTSVLIEQIPDDNQIDCCPLVRASLRPPHNTQLRRLKVVHDPQNYTWDAGYLWIPMLDAPQLTYLAMQGINFEAISTQWRTSLQPNTCPNLHTLMLSESVILPSSLLAISHACPNIWHLDLEFVDETQLPSSHTPTIDSDTISPWRYRSTLLPDLPFHRLRTLRLLMALTTDTFPAIRSHTLDLRPLLYLHTLEISDWLLFDRPRIPNRTIQLSSVLPTTLQKLKIKPSHIERPANITLDAQFDALELQLHHHIEAQLQVFVGLGQFRQLELVVAPRTWYIARLWGRGNGVTSLMEYNAVPHGFAWRVGGYVVGGDEQTWLDAVEPVDTFGKAGAFFQGGGILHPV